MLHLDKNKKIKKYSSQSFICISQKNKTATELETGCGPYLHPFPARAHVFAEHDVVEGHGPDEEEHLLDHLVDQALLHAVLAHGGVEDAELLNDGGDGVGLRVLRVLDAVGALPETRGLHAGDALQTLVLQHAGNCVRASEEELLMSCSARLKVKHRRGVDRRVTDGGDEAPLQDGDELVVDVDGQVADDLSVFGQVKVLQAVLLLPRRALLHELLL